MGLGVFIILALCFKSGLSVVYCDSIEGSLVVIPDILQQLGRLSKLAGSMIYLTPYITGVIVGLLLSDGWLALYKGNKHARLGFKQSTIHNSYFWSVFTMLAHYCNSYPNLTVSIVKGLPYFGVQLQTRSLPCFTELHSLFYVNLVKVLPRPGGHAQAGSLPKIYFLVVKSTKYFWRGPGNPRAPTGLNLFYRSAICGP